MTLKQALQIFGLDDLSGISREDLKLMYKKLAKTKHPDLQGGNSEEFIELQTAFEVLSRYLQYIPNTNKNLADLTKEQILEIYQKDTNQLRQKIQLFQEQFTQQNQILEDIRTKVEQLISDFEARKKELKETLEKELAKLERQYTGAFWRKLLFFWPRMSEEEFWQRYQDKANLYSKKHLELDVAFLREVLTTYGEGLNRIKQSIQDSLDNETQT